MRPIDWIVIHHSVSPPITSMETIRQWHGAKGWSDIGYHYVIHLDVDSEVIIQEGRPLDRAGAHCRPRNGDSIGICVSGNYSEAEPDPVLWGDAVRFCVHLIEEHRIPVARVIGHREAPWATECPGLLWDMDEFRDAVRLLVG